MATMWASFVSYLDWLASRQRAYMLSGVRRSMGLSEWLVVAVQGILSVTGLHAVDVSAGDAGGLDFGFVWACSNGHLGVVRELLALSDGRSVEVCVEMKLASV